MLASLLLGSENNVLDAAFSSIPGGNWNESKLSSGNLSETRRNCRTVDGLFPKLRLRPSGCLTPPLDRRFVFARLTDGDASWAAGVRRTVEFGRFGTLGCDWWCGEFVRSSFCIILVGSSGHSIGVADTFRLRCVFFIVGALTVSKTQPSSSSNFETVFLEQCQHDPSSIRNST
jgi:hypothetical protein